MDVHEARHQDRMRKILRDRLRIARQDLIARANGDDPSLIDDDRAVFNNRTDDGKDETCGE